MKTTEIVIEIDSRTTSTTAVSEGCRIARLLFAKRGNHSEVHLRERELAVALAYAFQRGAEWGVKQGRK